MAQQVQPAGVTTLVDLIGNTPLLRLRSFERLCPGVELYAKAEWHNPGGSVKDRPAARMIVDGVASGALRPNKILLDATSGNTGIAYAMIGAASGYQVKLCVPTNVTAERKKILRAYGAELVYTDPMDGSDGAIARPGGCLPSLRMSTSIQTSTTTTRTGGRTMRGPAERSWSRPTVG